MNDFAHILSIKEAGLLEEKSKTFEAASSCEIAIVTISSTGGVSIEQYAARVFEKWGIGKKAKNNGVLLLVAYKDRKVRIATGKGIENILTDSACKMIIDEVLVPHFKTKDFYEGIDAAVDEIETYLSGSKTSVYNDNLSTAQTAPVASYTYDASPPAKENNSGFWTILLLMLAGGIVYVVSFFTRQGYWVSPSSWPCDDYGRRDYYDYDRYSHSSSNYTDYSSASSSSSSSGNESSSAGFGGGTSGGGGASGSW
ncbi:MAG: TPM domain-containing protein [Ferruginibacter sp.]